MWNLKRNTNLKLHRIRNGSLGQETKQTSTEEITGNKLITKLLFMLFQISDIVLLIDMWCASSLSRVRLFATSWTVACQVPLSIGILQARILEWVAIPFSRGSSQPRDQTQVFCIAGRFFTIWVTRKALNRHVPKQILLVPSSLNFFHLCIYKPNL